MRIEHIGIAVKDLESSVNTYESLLNAKCYKREAVASEKVETAFFKTGELKLELLAATAPKSVIAAFIEQKGEGLHHIAFEVGDIVAEMKRLETEGFNVLNEKPRKGADDKWVAFVHPKDNHGVLIEICQSIKS